MFGATKSGNCRVRAAVHARLAMVAPTVRRAIQGGLHVKPRAPNRIVVVAGDTSGDALGADLVETLAGALPGARFLGIGGPKMQSVGFEAWYPPDTLAAREIGRAHV